MSSPVSKTKSLGTSSAKSPVKSPKSAGAKARSPTKSSSKQSSAAGAKSGKATIAKPAAASKSGKASTAKPSPNKADMTPGPRVAEATLPLIDALTLSGEAPAAPAAEPEVPKVGNTGEAMVRYNHYRKMFPITDGILKWADVDDEYCISFVFKGAFGRRVVHAQTEEVMAQQGDLYSGLVVGGEYVLHIDEDEAAQAALGKKGTPYVPPSSSGMGGRVIESGDGDSFFSDSSSCSCLYGNPCVSAYNCKDWNNRFDVAKRNGWKGFS
eukprot:CAMPEP_0206060262 /NCGR_PEP_ID=MMETSP1466-20131121/50771_1 /ASSEMBLY_ACC=CAM_ASM_001126 /TAXON_ID=44452 /ORGANISM="Pavlova gyrans, Strain CCMP608" /LENGTH=267 /DNA_ID=CAMNT_0053435601 /DNA_START=34 /DNA_END=837 /DNA_ORIENTATION=-